MTSYRTNHARRRHDWLMFDMRARWPAPAVFRFDDASKDLVPWR